MVEGRTRCRHGRKKRRWLNARGEGRGESRALGHNTASIQHRKQAAHTGQHEQQTASAGACPSLPIPPHHPPLRPSTLMWVCRVVLLVCLCASEPNHILLCPVCCMPCAVPATPLQPSRSEGSWTRGEAVGSGRQASQASQGGASNTPRVITTV